MEIIKETCRVSSFDVCNVIWLYMILCMLWSITITIFKIIVELLLHLIIRGIYYLGYLFLGKNHQKSLRYNVLNLWYIKFSADVSYCVDFLRYDIVETYTLIGGKDFGGIIDKAFLFSLENLKNCFICIFRYFSRLNVLRVSLLGISVYVYYKEQVTYIIKRFIQWLGSVELEVSHILDGFEVITILFLIIYILFDIRHKANGYSELRSERFKLLFQMEEKLYDILQKLDYSLDKNMDVLAKYKCSILQDGAKELSGKSCYIDNEEIKFLDRGDILYNICNHINHNISELDDMTTEFDELKKLEAEFKESSISLSNIYLVDYQTMLTRVIEIWMPGRAIMGYKKQALLCRSSLEKWYNNFFVNPTRIGDEVLLFSEEKTKNKILDASAVIDDNLESAMCLKLYLKKYQRKMRKRFRKIHRFTRYRL